MGKFTKFSRKQLRAMRPEIEKATYHAAKMTIAEQRRQIEELLRLVRYQKLHIARLTAGEDVE